MLTRLVYILILGLYSCSLGAQEAKDTTILLSADTIKHESFFKQNETGIGIGIAATMVGYGIISLNSGATSELDHSTKQELHEDNSMFYNGIDNFMQFAPAAMAFGLKLFKVESTHKLSDMVILYALSNVLETGIVYTTKNIVDRERPNGAGANSFPSGHTATAFVAAEFLYQEYKHQSLWLSVSGYAIASLIGASRVLNDKHWVSDVIAGAGIGILSTKFVYWVYPHLKGAFCKNNNNLHTFVYPSYQNGYLTVSLSHTF